MRKCDWIGLFFCAAGPLFLFIFILFAESRNKVRNEAIEAGVAEWTIDSKTGKKSFEWITDNRVEETKGESEDQ